MREIKKSYWTDFEKFGKRCEKSIFVPIFVPCGTPIKKEKNTFLVFTHRTIPENLKEIRPAVSETQMLTDRWTDEKWRQYLILSYRKVPTISYLIGHLAFRPVGLKSKGVAFQRIRRNSKMAAKVLKPYTMLLRSGAVLFCVGRLLTGNLSWSRALVNK